MIFTRVPRDEQGCDLISNQFIYKSISLDENPNRSLVKAIHQATELGGIHFLRNGGRAAHIYEQHSQHNLSAPRKLGCERVAGSTKSWIFVRLVSSMKNT